MDRFDAGKIPVPTLERLATCLTVLTELTERRVETISSKDIEDLTGINAPQFRKDLSYFGEFGRPGIGYNVEELRSSLARILQVEKRQPVVLVGAGNLGSALTGYPGLRAQNFHIVAAFDNNPDKIGKPLWDVKVYDIADLTEVNSSLQARIGILAAPAFASQEIAARMIDAGIEGILNFAPAILRTPPGIVVRNVDFVQEMAVLAFHLSDRTDES